MGLSVFAALLQAVQGAFCTRGGALGRVNNGVRVHGSVLYRKHKRDTRIRSEQRDTINRYCPVPVPMPSDTLPGEGRCTVCLVVVAATGDDGARICEAMSNADTREVNGMCARSRFRGS